MHGLGSGGGLSGRLLLLFLPSILCNGVMCGIKWAALALLVLNGAHPSMVVIKNYIIQMVKVRVQVL